MNTNDPPAEASGEHPSSDYQYDVCLSFAGEQRAYVEQVARILRDHSMSVFYDRYETAALWGKDLYEHLDWVYREAARYCVLFASADYAAKNWPTHERRSAQARALEQRHAYLLPARFDDTEIPGLPPTIAYIDLRENSPEQLADLLIRKLEQDATGANTYEPRVADEARMTRPSWDEDTGECRGIDGSPVILGQWQVSAPRHLHGATS